MDRDSKKQGKKAVTELRVSKLKMKNRRCVDCQFLSKVWNLEKLKTKQEDLRQEVKMEDGFRRRGVKRVVR